MKLRKFLKTAPMKLYLILLAVVAFAFFSNDFGLVDIQKTAIILAAGIDRTESGYSLTAQIAVPKGTDRTTGGTSSVEIEAEGQTVSDCISLIFSKTGWVPKLVFCDLIVLGEEAAKEDVVSSLNYFLRNDYMPDSCLLAVCEGKAGELISSKSAIDDASSLAIEKLFSDAAVRSGKVVTNTLKDFAIDYYGVSKSSYLPYVRMTDQAGSQGESGSGGSSGGSGGGSGSSGGSESDGNSEKIYSAEETAIFKNGAMVGLLPREQTLAFSLLQGNMSTGTVNSEEDGRPVTLTVMKNEGSVALKTDGTPRAELSLEVTVRLCCRGTTAAMEDISSDSVTPTIIRNTEERLGGYIRDLWQTTKDCGCDIFKLNRMLYRSSLKQYARWKDTLLDVAEADVSAKVISMK